MVDDETVDALVKRLRDRAKSESAARFPTDRDATALPGLYSWWADDEARRMLKALFGVPIPSLIYVGQTGATSTRAGKLSSATLHSRICRNHLNGNIGSSTFRKTMSAALLKPLSLRLSKPNCLEKTSNEALSGWMREHLRIVVAPHSRRGQLAAVETAVLKRINPPLNLKGMPRTPTRTTLRTLRRLLGVGHGVSV